MKPILFFLSIVLLLTACKKLDKIVSNPTTINEKVNSSEKFFEIKDSIYPEVYSVIRDIKLSESNKEFLVALSKVNGYPIWEKAIGTFSSSSQKIIPQKKETDIQQASATTEMSYFLSFIPLRDTVTNEILSYIFCDRTPNGFKYKIYNKKEILGSKPKSLHDLDNKGMQLAVFSHFERDINQKSSIDFGSVYNFKFKDVSIKFNANSQTAQNQVISNSTTDKIASKSLCTGDGDIVIQWGNLFGENPCAPKVHHFYICYGGVRTFKPDQNWVNYPCGKIGDAGNGGSSASNLFLLSSFLSSSPTDLTSNINQFQNNGGNTYDIPSNWSVDYSTLWLPSNTERGDGDPRQKYNYLNNKIPDLTLRNSYKYAYADVEWEFYNQPIDEFTFLSSSEFFDVLSTNSTTTIPTPITVLAKAGASGAADFLLQMLFIRLSNPSVHSYGECLPFIDWSNVALATFMGGFTFSTPYIEAAIAGSTFAVKSMYNGDSWESIGMRFMEGFLSSIAGSSFSHFINDKFAGNINTLGNSLIQKFGNYVPYSKITSWLGGGLKNISKTYSHASAFGGTITANKMIKGWDPTKVAIIGRNMDDRVVPFANQLSQELGFNVVTIKQVYPNSIPTVEQNKAWILQLKKEGYTFYDVGLDPHYTSGVATGIPNFEQGPHCNMELYEIFR